jgi:hypothetical protein
MINTAVAVQAAEDALRAALEGAERALAGAEAQLDKLREEAQEAGTCCP